jgi:hypothetical protein
MVIAGEVPIPRLEALLKQRVHTPNESVESFALFLLTNATLRVLGFRLLLLELRDLLEISSAVPRKTCPCFSARNIGSMLQPRSFAPLRSIVDIGGAP